MKKLIILAMLALFAVPALAQQLPILQFDEVEVDGTELSPNAINRLNLDRGEEYQVRVQFTPLANIKSGRVKISIDGYEFSEFEDITDASDINDYKANNTYVEKLSVRIPDDAELDSYKLRVELTNRNSQKFSVDYNLEIDAPRNAVSIEDIFFNPSDAVRAGSSLLAKVRVENKGQKNQDDVRVTVSIPGLGVSGTSYIEEIENDDEEEETEEIFLRIPRCAKPGAYDVNVEVEFNDRHRKSTERKSIIVLEDETCTDQKQTTITLGNQAQNANGGQTAVYPITITNAGKTSKTFTLTVQQADWAQVTVSPTSTLVVPAGQTQTIFVNVLVNEEAQAGAHSLTARVTSGKDTQELTLTTTVQQKESSLRGVFEVTLVVLVVLLIILALVIGIVHLKTKEQTETYY